MAMLLTIGGFAVTHHSRSMLATPAEMVVPVAVLESTAAAATSGSPMTMEARREGRAKTEARNVTAGFTWRHFGALAH